MSLLFFQLVELSAHSFGGCLNACSKDTFFVLDWLRYREETLPRYPFFFLAH